MTCFVKKCANDPTTGRDMDPDRTGGWTSYSYEVALCQSHDAAITAGADWICRLSESGDKEVLMGDQIAELDKFVIQSVPMQLHLVGDVSWRHSGVLPVGPTISLEVQKVGAGRPSTIDLYPGGAAQARKLIEVLEMYAELEEEKDQRRRTA
jgi:hypothetical protein